MNRCSHEPETEIRDSRLLLLHYVPEMLVTEAFLRSGSRSGMLASIRKGLALKFVYDYGLSMAETGRRLGVTTNAVGYMVRNR
ncbi:hypothetical protein [Chlorobium phaeobacteroides]|uniref:hypothetical protein n=1 Tax=Chlorobium phaeobacteroides TaxID=1096 RepID=UPI000053827B|nr:hypothetical protein [Chlorobium phaeobacteroides]